jgi:mutator protein MutT
LRGLELLDDCRAVHYREISRFGKFIVPRQENKDGSMDPNSLVTYSAMTCETVVTAAIIQRKEYVLLARRSPGEKLAGFWEFPGGKVEDGETPEACLARELDEERRITVRIGAKCVESLHQYDHGSFRIVAYFVEWLAGDPRNCGFAQEAEGAAVMSYTEIIPDGTILGDVPGIVPGTLFRSRQELYDKKLHRANVWHRSPRIVDRAFGRIRR